MASPLLRITHDGGESRMEFPALPDRLALIGHRCEQRMSEGNGVAVDLDDARIRGSDKPRPRALHGPEDLLDRRLGQCRNDQRGFTRCGGEPPDSSVEKLPEARRDWE